MNKFYILALVAMLAGCAELTKIDSALQTACSDATTLAPLAVVVTGGTSAGSAVSSIASYIQSGRGTAEGIAKLATDPTSTQWVSTLIGELKTYLPR